MRIKLILNPNSGNGLGISHIPIIKKKFKNWQIDIYKTRSKGDATKEAKKSGTYDIVIVAGGDGTINEVINGLAGSKVKLGIIPIGTGNVFAKELKLPINIHKICNIIKKTKTRVYDLGKANNNYFLLCCGIGFDASVLKEMNPLIKKILGVFSYPVYAIKRLVNYNAPLIYVRANSKKKKGFFLIVSNIKEYAGLFEFSPDANPYDGKLDACLFEYKIKFFRIIKELIKVKSKLKLKPQDVLHYQFENIRVESDSKVLVQTDGEIIGTTPVDIKVVPKAISIIVP